MPSELWTSGESLRTSFELVRLSNIKINLMAFLCSTGNQLRLVADASPHDVTIAEVRQKMSITQSCQPTLCTTVSSFAQDPNSRYC